MVIVKDCFNPADGYVCIVSMHDKVSEMWGYSAHYITEEQIDELKKGKAIYFDDGEYSHLIAIREETHDE